MRNRGPNQKAESARARKAAVDKAATEAKLKAAEDAKWVDEDKHVQAKASRKLDQERKADEKQKKRLELKELEERETAELTKKSTSSGAKKLTRADIQQTLLLNSMKQKEKQQPQPYIAEEDDIEITEFRDRMLKTLHGLNDSENNGEESIDASGLDAILDAIAEQEQTGQTDRHPEKRLRAKYAAFVEEEMPRVKAEYPKLKRSQYLDMIYRKWQLELKRKS